MKDSQLQVRVTRQQKSAIKRAAARCGQDLSSWVLSRCLGEEEHAFSQIVGRLVVSTEPAYVLAELNDLLTQLKPDEFADAVTSELPDKFDVALANRVAAMVEYAAQKKGVAPPEWTAGVSPLAHPVFDTELQSLRIHLLLNTPAPFKRRNIFLDASIGDRA